MISRKELVKFVNRQLFGPNYDTLYNKFGKHHYGIQELKDLLDLIYKGVPENKEEELHTDCWDSIKKWEAKKKKGGN